MDRPTTTERPDELSAELWDKVLTDGHASLVWARRVFRYLPSSPRCKLCSNPFGGVGGRVLRIAGFKPSRKNPNLDKLIGDEVMAFFVHGITGPDYRRRAVDAGIDLLRAVGYGSEAGPWIEVGVAVNAGVAYVGNVGSEVLDFTALGDPVNVAARMQESAAAGELLVAEGVADELVGPRRTLTVRGRTQPVEALVLAA